MKQEPLAWEPREPADDTPDVVASAMLAQQFQEFAEQSLARLPLYRRLAEGCASDLEVAGRLLLAKADQQVPNLLLAAVHDVLLAGEEDRLADWYPTVLGRNPAAGARARTVGDGDDDPWPHFRRLALHHPGVEQRLRTASTQTNEVGRSPILFPALFAAARGARSAPSGGARPIGLVEIGSSAGLNLNPGLYGYRYRIAGDSLHPEQVITSVGVGSKLMIDCDLRGDRVPPLPEGGLAVETAVGIDQRPLFVTRNDDARWLVACLWPEETARMTRLRAAIALAHEEPPVVEAGDAVDDLSSHLARVPAHALPVVMSSWVLAYLSLERQQAFLRELERIGTHRDVALVFAEQPERIPGIPVPGRPDGVPDGRATAVVRMEWCDGEPTSVRLADAHPHGRWLEWLDR